MEFSAKYQKSRELFNMLKSNFGITDATYSTVLLMTDCRIKIEPKKRWSEDELLLLVELELNGFVFNTYDPKVPQAKRKYKTFKTVNGLLKFIENSYK